jgi:hypothetical protein
MRLGCAGLHPALRGRHNVTMPRRELIPLAACIAALALTACTTDSSSAASPRLTRSESGTSRSSPHAHASYRPGVVYASRSAHVYRGTETFCLRSPLSGTARYSFHAGRASFTLDIHGFPAKTGVGLDWINNPVRGDLVGTFSTDASGSYVAPPKRSGLAKCGRSRSSLNVPMGPACQESGNLAEMIIMPSSMKSLATLSAHWRYSAGVQQRPLTTASQPSRLINALSKQQGDRGTRPNPATQR